MYNWNLKINKCVLAGLRAITHKGTDPITHRTCQEIREYLFCSVPFKYQDQVHRAIKKINQLENQTVV